MVDVCDRDGDGAPHGEADAIELWAAAWPGAVFELVDPNEKVGAGVPEDAATGGAVVLPPNEKALAAGTPLLALADTPNPTDGGAVVAACCAKWNAMNDHTVCCFVAADKFQSRFKVIKALLLFVDRCP
jgi:hypothetical protein